MHVFAVGIVAAAQNDRIHKLGKEGMVTSRAVKAVKQSKSKKEEQEKASVYHFPIKGGVIKRELKRPTTKVSFKIARPIVERLLRCFIHFEVTGKENLPSSGPVIVVFNHLHLLDPPLHIIGMLPRDIIIMAKEELFFYWPMPVNRILMDIAEAYPVRRLGTPEERQKAVTYANEVLKRDILFGIYPEGTRSKAGHLKEAYHGCAQIAWRTGVPLIPVTIRGTEKLRGSGWLKRPKVTITIGKPFTLPLCKEEPTEEQLKEWTELIMCHLAAYLPPEYHGRYKPVGQCT
ncbi:MAG: 1-acyl-sn-glycerol-3-phosphate acyltransferase [Chloroflexi bacterium]|nr:1-acyl-sn-glycerol-3-phosphate acyltransferase [Chloroflexota bacterium]